MSPGLDVAKPHCDLAFSGAPGQILLLALRGCTLAWQSRRTRLDSISSVASALLNLRLRLRQLRVLRVLHVLRLSSRLRRLCQLLLLWRRLSLALLWASSWIHAYSASAAAALSSGSRLHGSSGSNLSQILS